VVVLDISVSLDGYVAGPNATLDEPLGENGELLHEWIFGLASWREAHGLEGGERGADDDVIREWVHVPGAVVMGRRMFSGGAGPWDADPKANGWWGDRPPFDVPVFVISHHAREPLTLGATKFTFVNGVEAALAEARRAAGDRPVQISGGAAVVQQALRAGLLDRMRLHLVPVLLGGGVPLFEGLDSRSLTLERVRSSGAVAHLEYAVS
jgi:dihydrofolate reductase